jgi:hypothetical protein
MGTYSDTNLWLLFRILAMIIIIIKVVTHFLNISYKHDFASTQYGTQTHTHIHALYTIIKLH